MKKVNVNIVVEEKAGRTFKEVTPSTPNWGIPTTLNLEGRYGDSTKALVDFLSRLNVTSAQSEDEFEITTTVTQMMQDKAWQQPITKSGIIPAWYWVYWGQSMKSLGKVINPDRVIEFKALDEIQTYHILDKGTKSQKHVYPQQKFMESWRKKRQETKITANDKRWPDMMKKSWPSVYVWTNWEISFLDTEQGKALWTGLMFKLSQVGDPSKVKVTISVKVYEEEKAETPVPDLPDVQKAA